MQQDERRAAGSLPRQAPAQMNLAFTNSGEITIDRRHSAHRSEDLEHAIQDVVGMALRRGNADDSIEPKVA
ncbi:MAG: hypothetical protein OXC14_16925, partial [Rhodospirillaceae bacterium]|nr:hypothetical protein [Rhodospirillaceae bacterium]